MIAMGRVLTGRMPDDEGEDDFRCFTCSLSKFVRKNSKPSSDTNGTSAAPSDVQKWNSSTPDLIPDVNWRNGTGVAGGWVCEINGDCSFLSGGEERG
ncbi:C6 zinc cluster transcription factor-like protein, partial [Cryomyces antarcticus]